MKGYKSLAHKVGRLPLPVNFLKEVLTRYVALALLAVYRPDEHIKRDWGQEYTVF